jgi:3',5'-nucleoside bisphosphate phosphatase
MSAGIFADLHCHSTASDGVIPPGELVRRARHLGLGALAITDHDTLAGLPEAAVVGREEGVQVVAGIELSCGWPEVEASFHVLGLFVDPDSAALTGLLDRQRRSRYARAFRILDRLHDLGIDVEPLRQQFAADPERVLGRPHVARFLLDQGIVPDFQAAFANLLGRGAPAYVPKDHVVPADGVAAIHGAGGLAVIAHPGLHENWELVWPLVQDVPWDGIEVFYAEHRPEQIAFFTDLAMRRGWFQTGGSDYHGEYGKHSQRFGSFGLTREQFAPLAAWHSDHSFETR